MGSRKSTPTVALSRRGSSTQNTSQKSGQIISTLQFWKQHLLLHVRTYQHSKLEALRQLKLLQKQVVSLDVTQ